MELLKNEIKSKLCQEAVKICMKYGYVRAGFLLARILDEYWDEIFQRLMRELNQVNLTNY